MTLLIVLLLPFTAGVALCAFITWPLAFRAGRVAHERDQAEIARILTGFDAPPPVRVPIDWRAPTAAHELEPLRRTGPGVAAHGPAALEPYRPKHAMVRAHLAAAGLIGRPPLAVVA